MRPFFPKMEKNKIFDHFWAPIFLTKNEKNPKKMVKMLFFAKKIAFFGKSLIYPRYPQKKIERKSIKNRRFSNRIFPKTDTLNFVSN